MEETCAGLLQAIRPTAPFRPCGTVKTVRHGMLKVAGLAEHATMGAPVRVMMPGGRSLPGEIVRLDDANVSVLTGGTSEGVSVGQRVVLYDPPVFSPADHWVGRIIDPYGNPLDGRPLLPGPVPRSVQTAPPAAAGRRALGPRLTSGLAVLDTVLPIVRGQRIGLFAGSGVGKSRLLAQLAQSMDVDVTVIALIGERGREVAEFARDVLGSVDLARSVLIAATSDQSPFARRQCACSAMAVAEHFRDQGKQVLFMADSITRLAEAQREVAAVSGEPLSLRGFPPSLPPMIASLCERAGPGTRDQGDITAIFSVLVAGSDMEEPVADIVRGVLDGHIVLSRDIAERGRFPAIDVLRSVSRALPNAANDAENAMIRDVRKLLGSYENAEVMIRAGLYSEGSDQTLDRAVKAWPDLDAFFGKLGGASVSDSFDRLSLILRRKGNLQSVRS